MSDPFSDTFIDLAPDSAPMNATEAPTDPMEQRLREFFDQNLERLRLEGGHSLAPRTIEMAWQQVRCYWYKLRSIAERVTDTEVRLTLPDQRTPAGRPYSIEGIVDLVREEGRTTMYDLKTHEATSVRDNPEQYADQLNVYTHIWEHLRGQRLDETAVIATALPFRQPADLVSASAEEVLGMLQDWDPVVPIPFDPARVDETITRFGRVVDQIEVGAFQPAPLDRLTRPDYRDGPLFARNACRNCDGRFSCDSYRRFIAQNPTQRQQEFLTYYVWDVLEDPEEGEEERAFRIAAAATAIEQRQADGVLP